MKLTFTGLFFLAICLAGCDRQPDFSINKEDTNSLYANNPSFKNVNHRAYTYYFKGAPTAYYGISMQGKVVRPE